MSVKAARPDKLADSGTDSAKQPQKRLQFLYYSPLKPLGKARFPPIFRVRSSFLSSLLKPVRADGFAVTYHLTASCQFPHQASTLSIHFLLSEATTRTSFQDLHPARFLSFSIVRRYAVFSLPLFLLPSGAQVRWHSCCLDLVLDWCVTVLLRRSKSWKGSPASLALFSFA